MDLKMRSIHMNKVKCRETFQLTIDDDVNVPDNKPDVRMVVWKNATVKVGEKKTSGEKLYLKGTLAYHVLYLSEDKERMLQSVRGELPFEETLDLPGECAGDSIVVKAELENVQIGMIHSRKLSVYAQIGMLVQAEELFDVRTAVGLANGAEESAENRAPMFSDTENALADITTDCGRKLHTKTRTISVTSIAANKKDTARLREELFLPSGKESVEELLYWELTVANAEARARDEAVEVKGELSMFALWRSGRAEGEPEYMEAVLPFKTEFEISGCREGMIEDVTFRLVNEGVSVKSDEDGEDRLFVAEGVLEAEIKLYEEGEMEILSDLYAEDCITNPVLMEEEYENLLMKNDSRLRLAEHLSIPQGMPDILQVCRGRAELRPDVCVRDGEALKLSGTVEVSLLYITGEDDRPLVAFHTDLPFEHRIEIRGLTEDSVYDIQCHVSDTGFGTVRNREAEMKAELSFSVLAMEKCREPMITGVSCEEFDEDRQENLPSMIGYTVKAGEELWDIAKQFLVAEEEIMRLDEHGAQVREGEQLLIVKTVPM